MLPLSDESRFGKFNALNKCTGTDGSDFNITRKKPNDIWFDIICKRKKRNDHTPLYSVIVRTVVGD